MLKSIIGTKIGMTQVFDQTGNIVPVTIISAGPCVITNILTKEKDGYAAIQLGYGEAKEKNGRKLLPEFSRKIISRLRRSCASSGLATQPNTRSGRK